MIKKMSVTVALAGALSFGLALPAVPAGATANPSRLAQCERSAAERYARRLQGATSPASAKRQFENDKARCQRRFG